MLRMAKTRLVKYYEIMLNSANGSNIASMNLVRQHGDTSILLHALAVSYYSCLIGKKLRLNLDYDSMSRGALLHDYFGYDWHRDSRPPRHALKHGIYALKNARREFDLNSKEADIISHHMFPLAAPPRSREAWLVSLVDKGCAVKERFTRDGYPHLHHLVKQIVQA